MLRIFLGACVGITLVAQVAVAQPADFPRSEYFWQAPYGSHAVLAGATFSHLKVTGSNSSNIESTAESRSVLLDLQYEYGLTQQHSMYVRIPWIDTEFESYSDSGTGLNGSSVGLTDWLVGTKGYMDFGSLFLRYGADLNLSLQKSKLDNAYSGQTSLVPYIGVEFPLTAVHIVGTRLSHEFHIGRSVYVSSSGDVLSSKSSRLTELLGFYEYSSQNWTLGLALSYHLTSDWKNSSGTDRDQADSLLLTGYGAYVVSESLELLPSLQLSTIPEQKVNSSTIDTALGTQVRIAVRWQP